MNKLEPDIQSNPAPMPETVRWRELLTREYGVPLALVCLGVWLHAADSLLVATMIPAIVGDIGGAGLVAWTVALYEVGSIVAAAASGLVALRYGLKYPMACSAALFAGGCLVSTFAPSMPVMLVGRLMQGLGGGGLVALSFVAVGILFPARLMPRAMAAMSTLWGVSGFLGPLIGGLVVEYGTWRYGFLLFGVKALVLTVWILMKGRNADVQKDRPKIERMPIFRLACLSVGIVSIAYAGVDVTPLKSSLFIVLGIVFVWLFFRLDARHKTSRLMPKQTISLTNPVGAGLTMVFCFTMATIALSIYGPLLITVLHGTSPLVAGYIIACPTVGWSLMAVLVSGLPERHDAKVIGCGMVVLTLSVVGFAISVPNGPIWLIALFACLEGAGFGMAWTFILRRTTRLADAAETERVASAIPTIQRMGYAIGAAYVGLVANAAGIEQLGDPETVRFAARTMFLASLPFALIGLFAAIRFVTTRVPTPKTLQGSAR